jgi:hypothetical protein
VIALALTSAACGGSGGGGDGDSVDTIPFLRLDANGCEVLHINGEDSPGLYCLTKTRDVPLQVDFAYTSDPSQPIYRQEYAPENAGYDVRYYFDTTTWTRVPVGQSTPLELCWRVNPNDACLWVDSAGYREKIQSAWLNLQQQNYYLDNAQTIVQANADLGQEAQMLAEQAEVDPMGIITAPVCDMYDEYDCTYDYPYDEP